MALNPGDLNHLFVRAARMHHRRTYSHFAEYGIGEGQPRILWALSQEDGMSQAELGRRCRLEAATVTVTIARLEKRGLVERLPDPDDRRVLRVWMTPAGLSLHRLLDTTHQRIEREAFAGFDDADRERLAGYLERVRANLEKAEAMVEERRAREGRSVDVDEDMIAEPGA